MNRLKLTGLFSILLAITLFIVSCEQDNGTVPRYQYLKSVPLTGSQVVTPVTTTANGNIEGVYDNLTKTLTYRITLAGFARQGTTGSPTAIHIHAFADSGFSALPDPARFPSGPVQLFTSGWSMTDSTTTAPKTYSYVFNGTLFVDGFVVKEEDLLAGKYYVDVHTSNNPAGTTLPTSLAKGEIRGQLRFKP